MENKNKFRGYVGIIKIDFVNIRACMEEIFLQILRILVNSQNTRNNNKGVKQYEYTIKHSC